MMSYRDRAYTTCRPSGEICGSAAHCSSKMSRSANRLLPNESCARGAVAATHTAHSALINVRITSPDPETPNAPPSPLLSWAPDSDAQAPVFEVLRDSGKRGGSGFPNTGSRITPPAFSSPERVPVIPIPHVLYLRSERREHSGHDHEQHQAFDFWFFRNFREPWG